jgi:hypothetical protein
MGYAQLYQQLCGMVLNWQEDCLLPYYGLPGYGLAAYSAEECFQGL